MENMKNIAVFGGTFDPPTRAHEKIIEYALDQPYLDEVWIMPSGQRLDKPHMLDDATRLEMLEVMKSQNFAGNPKLKLSDFEMNLPQPSHTYATVQALARAYPECNFHFVFGTDSYWDMQSWEHGQWLRQNLHMLIVPRGGKMPSKTDKIRPFLVPEVEDMAISSTQAREALGRGDPIDKFVSKAVARFLSRRHCYELV